MSNLRAWALIPRVALLSISALSISACGGRAAELSGDSGGSVGGETAWAGASSGVSGAASGVSGAASGVSGASSGVSGADTGGGGLCNCPALPACQPGYAYAVVPGNCCAQCVPDGSGGGGGSPDCSTVDCAECPPGTRYQGQPGACCGSCVADPNACIEAAIEYGTLRAQLVSNPDALRCMTDTDCKILAINANCGASCESQPVNVTQGAAIEQQLSSFVADHCAACPAVYLPCAAPLPVYCSNGTCTNSYTL